MAKKFCRGLNEESFNKIKEFFDTELGQKIKKAQIEKGQYKDQPAFNICIREDYINIYWHGCSVLKYSPNATKNKFLIHKKYVEKDYIRLMSREKDLVDGIASWSFQDCIVNPAVKGDIKTVQKYAIGEKERLSCYLAVFRPFLLDLEIAFSRKSEKKGKNVADRIDIARLVYMDGVPMLQLVEVKIDSDPRLRSTFNGNIIEDNPPEIMKQMQHYQDFLNDEKNRIEKSYKKIAKNFIQLELIDRMPDLEGRKAIEVLEDFQNKGVIDPKPYLLIIGEESNLKTRNKHAPVNNHFDRLKILFSIARYPEPELVSL